jgi:hypothetical protein
MSGGQKPDPQNALLVCSHRVQTDARSVNAFAVALGTVSPAGTVPHTFPVSWLASDQVQTAMARLGGLPIQTFQAFTYYNKLYVDADYVLMLRLAPLERDAAFSCDAKVEDLAGATVLEMKSEIVVVANIAAAGAAK